MKAYWIYLQEITFLIYYIDIDEKELFYGDKTYRIIHAFNRDRCVESISNGIDYIIGSSFKEGTFLRDFKEIVKYLAKYPHSARKIFIKNIFGEK